MDMAEIQIVQRRMVHIEVFCFKIIRYIIYNCEGIPISIHPKNLPFTAWWTGGRKALLASQVVGPLGFVSFLHLHLLPTRLDLFIFPRHPLTPPVL